MISIRIGLTKYKIEDANESWVHEQVNQRRKDNTPVCVQVTIKTSSVDMMLSTPECGGGGGGNRRPNDQEKAIFDLWKKMHLSNGNFTSGNIIAFLRQVQSLI